MDILHLEFEGKSAKIPMRALPAKVKPTISYSTSSGKVASVLVRSGIDPFVQTDKLNFQDIIDKDDEILFDNVGEAVDRSSLTTAFYNPITKTTESTFEEIDVIYDAQGNEKQSRPHLIRSSNINQLTPIKVTKLINIEEAYNSFVFKHTYQLVHEDGLMRDFLYSVAEQLEQKKSMGVLGAGAKGNQPLIVRDKGNPYRAFLYGAIGTGENKGAYKLLILLSDQELKLPEA